jgi:aminoglycoside 2'-N-acetyltransferase I
VGDDITTMLVDDSEIEPALRAAALNLCRATFGAAFDDDDADHTGGGVRLLVYDEGLLVGHAAVVPRRIDVADLVLRAGYVEGVAVLLEHQGRGVGTRLMRAVSTVIERGTFEIGVLSTGRRTFYERVGWQRWHGPSYVRYGDGLRRTPDEDDGLLVLLPRGSAAVDLTASITCESRPGDDW